MERLKFIFLVIFIFSIFIIILSFHSRGLIKNQVIHRDAKLIQLLIQMDKPILYDGKFSSELPGWMLGETRLGSDSLTERFNGIVAVQVLDRYGKTIISIPENYIPSDLNLVDEKLNPRIEIFSQFHPEIQLGFLFADPDFLVEEHSIPLLEIIIPLFDPQSNRLEGTLQILLDGTSMSEELTELDMNILFLSGIALLGGCTIITLILLWAFKRLNLLNQELMKRTLKLQEANQELILSAKSSAIGAISTHLIHGLKNPLSGLQNYLTSQNELESTKRPNFDSEWHTAQETTRKMNRMLEDTLQILREEENGHAFEISWEEIFETLRNHISELAKKKNVTLDFSINVENQFNNRVGNLIILILDNLLKNAVEASPSFSKVSINAKKVLQTIEIRIEDEGTGLPQHQQENPFSLCISTKPDGNGIGLAISQQLARHLDARLTLEHSSSSGSCFLLILKIQKMESC